MNTRGNTIGISSCFSYSLPFLRFVPNWPIDAYMSKCVLYSITLHAILSVVSIFVCTVQYAMEIERECID